MTETPYFPNILIKTLLDKPTISAACPAESFTSHIASQQLSLKNHDLSNQYCQVYLIE